MLSQKTVALLNVACQRSDKLYDQGGLIYLYRFGHRRAHSFIDRQLLKLALYPKQLGDKEVDKLTDLFANALFQYCPANIPEEICIYVQKLVDELNTDFSQMYACISKSSSDGVSNMIELAFIKDNDFHTLELFWSID